MTLSAREKCGKGVERDRTLDTLTPTRGRNVPLIGEPRIVYEVSLLPLEYTTLDG
jgi:hypothetical protein